MENKDKDILVSEEEVPAGDNFGMVQDLLMDSDAETDPSVFGEDTIEKMMQELYREITVSSLPRPESPPEVMVPSPILSPSFPETIPPPPPPPSIFLDDGKNGSCGASVSALASTVMAGIDIAGSEGGMPAGKVESPVVAEGEAEEEMEGLWEGMEEDDKMEGCDEVDSDDEWLGRVLSWGKQELEERREFWM